MINKKKIFIFLLFAFGISWSTAIVILLTGAIQNSPELIPNSGLTLATVLLATGYMWGPAAANVLTRLITKTGKKDLLLHPAIKARWRPLLMGWFLPGILTIMGAILFFIVFPGFYDSNLSFVSDQLSQSQIEIPFSPFVFVLIQTISALLISAPINVLATFGEEFGWRGFLLPELMPLGKRKALIISGTIWGLWHWPAIAMGHNYGLQYPGFPWVGFLATIWVFISFGIVFGWLSLKGKSIWPAVLAHGSLNGIAAIGLLFSKGSPLMLLGPTPAGIISCLPFTVLSVYVLLKNNGES